MTPASHSVNPSAAPMATLYYTRTGELVPRPKFDEKGNPVIYVQNSCDRCGGTGGAQQWAHTGWTCYGCGGTGKGPIRILKLYTAEKLAKLDASQEKRHAKRMAAVAEEQAKRAAEIADRRAGFEAEHADLLEWLRSEVHAAAPQGYVEPDPYECGTETFIQSLLRQAEEKAQWSEGQIRALQTYREKTEARRKAAAVSQFIGTIGERLKLAVTVERVSSYEREVYGSHYGATEWVYVSTLRDAAGNALVVKSPRFHPAEGASIEVSGTVKEHSIYRDERQTRLERVKLLSEVKKS